MTDSDKQELQTKGLFPMDEDHKQKGYHSKSEMKRVEMMKDEQSADIVQLKEQLTKSACMYVAQSALLDKAVAALEALKPMTIMYSHQTFREGKDGPMKTELLPTYSGKIITEALEEIKAARK